MNIQSSLEFLLILSAIAALSLGVLSLYGNTLSAGRQLYGAFTSPNNITNNSASSAEENPELSAYIPLNSTTLSANPMFMETYGCSNGKAKLILNSGSVAFSNNNFSYNFTGAAIKYLYFDPEHSGQHLLNIDYNITCGKYSKSGNSEYNTYSSFESTQKNESTITAAITYENESISYPFNASNILSINESNHCTEKDVWTGFIYPPSIQCGSINSWDYMVFDGSCESPDWSYSRTYCFAPEDSGYSILIPDTANYSYSYKILVSIKEGENTLLFNLSSTDPSSLILLDGKVIGNATVESVTVSSPVTSPYIQSQWGYSQISTSAYSGYAEAESNAYQTLRFYNSTGVSYSTSSAIQEAVSAADSEEKSLISGVSQYNRSNSSCNITGLFYICKPRYPFTYMINLTFYNNTYFSIYPGNITLPYYGSIVNLR